MERIYSYSLNSHGNTKHIVDFSRSGIALCGRDFVWSVWDSEKFDLSKFDVCKQCERRANKLEREGEKVGS